MKIKTVLRFEDPALNRVFGKMDSTKNHRASVRSIYKTGRNEGLNRDEARFLGLGASMAFGFWTGENM